MQDALPCDAWHHYYHYQSSAQYLWLAEALYALGKPDEALTLYDRAIFQDHFNEEALKGKEGGARGKRRVPSYNKHPLFDLEFRSLIGELPDDATKPHDDGMSALLAGDTATALKFFEKALAAVPSHSNSFFGRGKSYFLKGDYAQAATDFAQAVRLSHIKHDAYHRTASAEHFARGAAFLKSGQLDLAVSDFTKALDLHRGNRHALAARANAYRLKGNEKLAEEDERRLTPLS